MIKRQITIIPPSNDKSDVCSVVICDLIGGSNKIDFQCPLGCLADIIKVNLKK